MLSAATPPAEFDTQPTPARGPWDPYALAPGRQQRDLPDSCIAQPMPSLAFVPRGIALWWNRPSGQSTVTLRYGFFTLRAPATGPVINNVAIIKTQQGLLS